MTEGPGHSSHLTLLWPVCTLQGLRSGFWRVTLCIRFMLTVSLLTVSLLTTSLIHSYAGGRDKTCSNVCQ